MIFVPLSQITINNNDQFFIQNPFSMKKVLLILFAVIGFGFAASAQNNAIGVRLSGGDQWYCAEISYQQSIGATHRIEADLGYRVDDYYDIGYLFLTGVYQLHFDIPAVKNLGWYFGFGPRVELFYYDKSFYFSGGVGAVGQIGMDYHFDAIPLQLSMDFRPCLYLIPYNVFQWGDFALSIRYTF